jgi:hypothetical protein
MKGIIMLNKIKNVFLHNNQQIQTTIRFGHDNKISFIERIKKILDFSPKYARQEIRIEKKRRF